MQRARIIDFVTTMSAAAFVSVAAQSTSLSDLTVPDNLLRPDCIISPTPTVRVEPNRVRGGLWAGLPIDRNPWIGSDRAITATIRERIDPPRRMPDGPPLSAAELARFLLGLADGVERSYAAVYAGATGEPLVTVYALEFPTDQDANRFRAELRPSPSADIFSLSRIVAVVAGPHNACRTAIADHVRTLR